ncbi:V-type ATPase subunit [Patescibacteria group bacterium]|nr:V-type ATPase subunit [Patescibacteria group bacterium]
MNSTLFTYASARVRAMEPMLLDHTDVERMLGAPSAREAYKILNDTAYANHIGDIEDVYSFQEVVTAGLLDSKEILIRICPQPEILDILFFRYDFHNMKSILKGMKHDKDKEEIEAHLLPLGRVPVTDLLTFFYDKDRPFLPLHEEQVEKIRLAIEIAKKLSEASDNDPRILDLVLDKHMMELVLNTAQKSKNAFVLDFVQKWVDLSNAKAFLRIKLLGQEEYFQEKGLINEVLADGGKMPRYKFVDSLDMDKGALANVFRGTDYHETIQKGLEAYEKDKSFAHIEQHADNYLMAAAKKSRFIPAGPEALISYFFAKQNNAQIIRIIMVGKLAALPEESIRERLNDLFT